VYRHLTKLGARFGIGGFLALIAPWLEAVPMPISIGVLLIGAGLQWVAFAFEAQTQGKGMLPLLLGLVSGVTGVCCLIWPSMTPVTLIALLATYSTLTGTLTAALGLQLRLIDGWNWVLVGGTGSLLAAVAIWFQIPFSGSVAAGCLLSVNLFAAGGWLAGLRGLERPVWESTRSDTDMSI
jgi:uncharacterized membrane protein HdeD (DUF308 family)